MIRDSVTITHGLRVKDLPEDMRVAFQPVPGATPEVAFRDGSFWSQSWREWDVTARKAIPGDSIILTANWGVRIIHIETRIRERLPHRRAFWQHVLRDRPDLLEYLERCVCEGEP